MAHRRLSASLKRRKWPKVPRSRSPTSWPRELSPSTPFIIFLVSTSQPGASISPSFAADGSQLYKPIKEEHLATRRFFVFVTASQLNSGHSALPLCECAWWIWPRKLWSSTQHLHLVDFICRLLNGPLASPLHLLWHVPSPWRMLSLKIHTRKLPPTGLQCISILSAPGQDVKEK